MDGMSQLQAHVRSHLASRVQYAQSWRVDELTRLVVRYWPHMHLEEIERLGGPNHKAIDHTMTLVRAQVRERWEAVHGVGPLWPMILGGTVTAISHVILGLWWRDSAWRSRLQEMGRTAD